MSIQRNNPAPHPVGEHDRSGPISNSTAPAGFAHELANLLDAGLRNVGLVLATLRHGEGPGEQNPGGDDAVHRLESANQVLRQMAQLLERWIRDSRVGHDHFIAQRTLGEAVEHAVETVTAAAEDARIAIQVDLAADAAKLPAGTLYPVIANALRNSIEAMQSNGSKAPAGGGCIQIRGTLEDQHIVLRVIDNGPGLDAAVLDGDGSFRFGVSTKPAGHGLGLALSGEIARELGGRLEIENAPGGGVVLTVTYRADAAAGRET